MSTGKKPHDFFFNFFLLLDDTTSVTNVFIHFSAENSLEYQKNYFLSAELCVHPKMLAI